MKRINLKNISFWLTNNSYILFMVFTFLSFYFDVSGALRQVLWVLLFFLNLKYVTIRSQMDGIVLFYFFTSFLTLSGNVVIPYPPEDFLKVLIYSYVPIIFYFIGKNRVSVYPTFMNRSNFGVMFLIILGFYFLLFPTDMYITKSLETINIHGYYTEESLGLARFASFMDSYHTANLGVCSLCFSFGILKYTNNKNKAWKVLAFLFIIVSVVDILLAMQRVAIYIGFLIFIYYLFFSGYGRTSTVIIVVALLGGVVYFLFNSADILFLEQITSRFTGKATSTLFSSRTNQWIEAFEGFYQAPLLGLGVGSSGHVAYVSNPQHPIVTDGSYFKILVEGGIISFIPFMIILILSLLKGFKYRKKYYIEFPLLFFFACSLLGANIIDMPYIIIFMWYIIGRINSNKVFIYE